MAIGDVTGKGLRAAAAMGRLRGGLHAYAIEDAPPADVWAAWGAWPSPAGSWPPPSTWSSTPPTAAPSCPAPGICRRC